MQLKKTNVGKKIVILSNNKANYIYTGSNYIIKSISDDGAMLLSGISHLWYGEEGVHFAFIEYPNKDMEIGDTVIVIEKTTTLEQGEEKAIVGFLCDDRNKIVLEGIIPGGWIEPRKLTKKIDISKLRMKKAIELFAQRGTTFFNDMFLSNSVKDILGKNLDDLDIKQSIKKLVTKNGNGIMLSEDLYTDSKYEELEIIIVKDPVFVGYSRSNSKADKTPILGKRLSDLRKNFNSQKEDDVVKLSCEFSNNGGHIKFGEFAFFPESLKVIKSSEYEIQTPVTVSIPF